MNLITNISIDNKDKIWILTYSKDFRGLKKYSEEGKLLEYYSLDLKYDYDRIILKCAGNYLFFAVYDEEEGQKIYRASVK